jgi:hypothetical protein
VKKTTTYLIALVAVLLTTAGCKYLKNHARDPKEIVLARVGDDYLYPSDVTGLQSGLSPKDSLTFMINYAESWTRRKLLLRKAEEYVPLDELGIAKKVEEYRQSLILYEYEKELINQKLDKAIPEQEIAAYYELNKTNFTLDADIYDIQFARFPIAAAELDKMQPILFAPKNEEESRKRDGYCKALATSYSLREQNWVGASYILKQFPLSEADLHNISLGKTTSFKNESTMTFICIVQVKHTGEAAPLAFISDQLKEVLVNKKKVVLIRKIYDKIYDEGVKSGDCEILVKK